MAKKGYTLVLIEGIPEGFAFKEPDIEIGRNYHNGRYTAFVPLMEWDEGRVWGTFEWQLLENYNAKKNGKK